MDLETVLSILTNEATLSFIFIAAGVLLKTFAPQWIPVLGASKKLIKELTELHEISNESKEDILLKAQVTEKRKAQKFLDKHLL